MLDFVRASNLRPQSPPFAVAVCRRILAMMMTDEAGSRRADKGVVERQVDGRANDDELARACDLAYDAYIETGTECAADSLQPDSHKPGNTPQWLSPPLRFSG